MLNPQATAKRIEQARQKVALTKEALRVIAHVSPGTLLKILAGDWETVPYGSISRVWRAVGLEVEEPEIAPLWARHLSERLEKLDSHVRLSLGQHAAKSPEEAVAGVGGAALHPAKAPLELVTPPGNGVIRIPMSKVAAGGGYFQETRTEPEAWYELPASLRPQDGELRVLEVHGDSMEPELREGDLIVVHYPSLQPAYGLLQYGEMYVITDEDYSDVVKRYVFDHLSGRDMLVSTNPAYLPTPLQRNARYIGRVKQVIKQD
jgi:SOS-response transcriptional repressor LexA